MASPTDVALNLVLGISAAGFTLGMLAYIAYQMDQTSNTTISDFFNPINSIWGTAALIALLGAAILIILPKISAFRQGLAKAA